MGSTSKIETLAILINELKDQLQSQLHMLSSENKKKIYEIIEKLQRIAVYESTVESIKADRKSCEEAAVWLNSYRNSIARVAAEKIISQGAIENYLKSGHSNSFSGAELEKRFSDDIVSYLKWIHKYIRDGLSPVNDFDKVDLANLDFIDSAYVEAFTYITDKLVNPDYSKLSDCAAEMLASYINLFFIEDQEDWNLFSDS